MKEVEKLGYYDFMTYVGVPFFHYGGVRSSLALAGLCRVRENKVVLMVGCGAGLSACFLARKLGCRVVGLDVARLSIEKARERAKREGLAHMTEFLVGSAHDLPFAAAGFDAVMTEFVAMFLDTGAALREFARVLKPGGWLGFNELFKEQVVPAPLGARIEEAQGLCREMTGLRFELRSREAWSKLLQEAGLEKIQVEPAARYVEHVSTRKLPEYDDCVRIDDLLKNAAQSPGDEKRLPGVLNSLLGLRRMLGLDFNRKKMKYFVLSGKVRERLRKMRKVQKVFFMERETARYVGCVFGIAQKRRVVGGGDGCGPDE